MNSNLSNAMQSFLQYRRISYKVHQNLVSDREKDIPSTNQYPLHEVPSQVHHAISASRTHTILAQPIVPMGTRRSIRTAVGHSLSGIHIRERTIHEGRDARVFIVAWDGDEDPTNPRNWSTVYRAFLTLMVASISFAVGAASSADAAILPQYATYFGVSDVVASLAIGRSLSSTSSLCINRDRYLSRRLCYWFTVCRAIF